jgi:uncharacterized protein (TIGR00369 family)
VISPAQFNQAGADKLPGHLGILICAVSEREVRAQMTLTAAHLAPNGYLHAGSVVSLADTCAGYGCLSRLPEGAVGFTTVELKSNHLATALEGTLLAVATPAHLGKSTQVWDSVVSHQESGRTLALFRCTQMILYQKPKSVGPP